MASEPCSKALVPSRQRPDDFGFGLREAPGPERPTEAEKREWEKKKSGGGSPQGIEWNESRPSSLGSAPASNPFPPTSCQQPTPSSPGLPPLSSLGCEAAAEQRDELWGSLLSLVFALGSATTSPSLDRKVADLLIPVQPEEETRQTPAYRKRGSPGHCPKW